MAGTEDIAAKFVRMIEYPFRLLARVFFPGWTKKREIEQQKQTRIKGTGSVFLCDSCKYNWGDVCKRPEKPNALECPDYKKEERS